MIGTYKTLAGRIFQLDNLNSLEKDFLREVLELYSSRPSWESFSQDWMLLARERLWKDVPFPTDHPLWWICRDLAARIGISEGRVAPPDYRDRLAVLIEERFKSRYEFCQKTGIDEGHLSRVVSGKKHFSPETLAQILVALDVQLDFVHKQDVLQYPIGRFLRRDRLEAAMAIDPVVKELNELEAKLLAIENVAEARLRGEEIGLVLAQAELAPQDRADLAARFSSRDLGAGVEAALEAALVEKSKLARRIEEEAREQLQSLLHARKQKIVSPQDGLVEATEQLIASLFVHGLKNLRRRYHGKCFFLCIPQNAKVTVLSDLGRWLNVSTSIIQGVMPGEGKDYGWVAVLKTPEIEQVLDKFGERSEDVYGAKLCTTLEEAESFLAGQPGGLMKGPSAEDLAKCLKNNPVFRLQFEKSSVRRPALNDLSQALGFSFTLVHACVIRHGYCDFIALDQEGHPLKSVDALVQQLTCASTYKHFGVEKVYTIKSLEDFKNKGLGRELERISAGEGTPAAANDPQNEDWSAWHMFQIPPAILSPFGGYE